MRRRKGLWVGLAVILVALAAAGGYYYYQYILLAPGDLPEPTIAVAGVQRGDIVVSVDGSGTLLPSTEIDLSFETGGDVSEVLVEVGDRVTAGDVIARLETDDLQTAVLEADIRLRQARLNLEALIEEPSEAEIADAEIAVGSAGDALLVAQYSYNDSLNSTLDAAVRAREIQFQYNVDQFYATEAGANDTPKAQARVASAWDAWARSEADLADAQKVAEIEQLEAWDRLDQAENRVAQAEERLRLLQSGPSEDAVLRSELSVTQAELSLHDAQDALEAAVLVSPIDGTIVAVGAIAGERVGAAPIVTLADLDQPLLQLWVEEQDMGGVSIGNRIEIYFEALPDVVFEGEIVRVDPALVTIDRTLAVQAWASVDVTSYPDHLLGGMNAEVEVISAESRDAVLVPLQALRELAPGSHAVFVVQPDGELQLRVVQVGLRDFVNAEILAGLEPGETVSLGEAQTSEEVVVPEEMPGGPGGPGGGIGGIFSGGR